MEKYYGVSTKNRDLPTWAQEIITELRLMNEKLGLVHKNLSFLATRGAQLESLKPHLETKNYETVNPSLSETQQIDECAKIIQKSKV